MTHFPFWFARALQRLRAGDVRSRHSEASQNAFDRVLWEIGVLLALALGLSAIVGVSIFTYGLN